MAIARERFTWQDGERTIHFGRGALGAAAASLGEGYTLLTTFLDIELKNGRAVSARGATTSKVTGVPDARHVQGSVALGPAVGAFVSFS